MRNIKFRAKSLIDNKFIYGNLIKMDEEEGNQCFIVPFYNHASSLSCKEIICMNLIPVDEKTISEFTGLKDMNGREIYEGDVLDGGIDYVKDYGYPIVKIGEYCDKDMIDISQYDDWSPKIEMLDDNELLTVYGVYLQGKNFVTGIDQSCTEAFEIIANIYDNPELTGNNC